MDNSAEGKGTIVFEATTTLDNIIIRKVASTKPKEKKPFGFNHSNNEQYDYFVEHRIKHHVDEDKEYSLLSLNVKNKLQDALDMAGSLCKTVKTGEFR